MITFAVAANCQVQSIELLLQHMVTEAVVWSADFTDPVACTNEAQPAVQSRMRSADFILIQPGGRGLFDARTVKRLYPEKTLVIANLYFRGLHPDCCYVGSASDRFQNPTLYHSIAILDAFRQGRSEKAAVKIQNSSI